MVRRRKCSTAQAPGKRLKEQEPVQSPMNVIKRLLFFACIALLYLILVPNRLGLEPVRSVSFAREIAPPSEWVLTPPVLDEQGMRAGAIAPVLPLTPFRSGELFGYLDGEGKIVHLEPVLHDVAYSERYYLNFESTPEQLAVHAPGGARIADLEASGYPVAGAQQVYVVGPSQDKLKAFDLDGEELWRTRFSAPITDLDSAAGSVVAGLLDGSVVYIEPTGELHGIGPDAHSEIAVVYGVALGPCGQTLAVLSGLGPQRLRIYRFEADEEGGETSLLHSRSLERYRREPALVRFSSDGRALIYEHGRTLAQLSAGTFEGFELDLRGEVVSLAFGGPLGSNAFVTEDNDGRRLAVFAPNWDLVLEHELGEVDAFVAPGDGCFVVGTGGVLLCIALEAG